MMRQVLLTMIAVCTFSTGALADGPMGQAAKFWPQWRGPNATGVAPLADPPIEWSETKNVRWKAEIPGHGLSSPIIWGDHVYVLAAVKTEKQVDNEPLTEPNRTRTHRTEPTPESELQPMIELQQPERPRRGRRGGWGRWRQDKPTDVHRFVAMAVNRQDGKIVWKKTLCEEVPHETGHPDSSQASNSPVTDGEHLYAYFGSRGLYCLDMEGNLQWKKDFGQMQTRMGFGEGSSPALHGDTIVLTWDHEGDSFIIALDKKTGKERWKVDRKEATSWATPLVVEHDGKRQVIAPASRFTCGYDLATGKLEWRCAGLTSNVISSPVCGFGMVFVMSGHRGFSLQAIRFGGATGDISGTDAVVWSYDRDTPYVPSPLLYDDTLYFLKRNDAILSCFNAKTGTAHYTRERLEGIEGVFASPVGARDRVFIVGRNGTTKVIARGPELKVLATNTLADAFVASPAIAGKELYLRGQKHLYCIAAP